MRHRGPDHQAELVAGPFGAVHTRLSIVDLSPSGNQPFTDGRYTLVYNGEIYNHMELRDRVGRDHPALRGTSDTASLFVHLCRFGVAETLRLARGMFAFAFHDALEAKVYLCRDRFGIKPLHWHDSADGLAWASEAKALSPLIRLTPDPVATLYGLVGVADHSATRTSFSKVRQVPPGHFIEYASSSGPVVREYYSLASQVDESYYRELDALGTGGVEDRFIELMSASTKSMLMSDAPMGAFVSGGIDSSILATLARDHHRELRLFTADVVGPHSELEAARLLASHLGRELVVSRFEPQLMIEDWARATWHHELPLVTHTNSLPFARVAATARGAGVKAVLSGEGSDELFLGYPRLLTRRYEWLARLPMTAVKQVYRLVPKLADLVNPPAGNLDSMAQLVRGHEQQRIRSAARPAFDFLPKARADEQYLTVQMFGDHLISLLHRNDRMGMSASIEARFPFLDEAVVRFGLNLPVRHKIGRSWRWHNYKHPFLQDKAIVRRASRRLLPSELALRPKVGFPMMGQKHIKVGAGFFADGFVSDLLCMSREATEFMVTAQSSYFIAKLASVEVFGRLYGMGQSHEEVTSHLQKWASMQIQGRSIAA